MKADTICYYCIAYADCDMRATLLRKVKSCQLPEVASRPRHGNEAIQELELEGPWLELQGLKYLLF